MKIFNIKYIGMVNDIFTNILSSALLVAVIQLLIFPYISRTESIENFGVIVSVYGFNNIIVLTIGNSLNNIRLINDDNIHNKGNFNRVLAWGISFGTILSIVLYYAYGLLELGIVTFIISIIFTLVSSVKAYLLTFFRISINYKKILITNLFVIGGVLLGLVLYQLFNIWSMIFLVGEVSGLIYLLYNTPFINENYKKDENYKKVYKDYSNLVASNGINSSLTYLDRFFITPVLGSSNMALYYSINVVGKFIGMVTTPFTNVLLSYINRLTTVNVKRNFLKLNLYLGLAFIPIYFLLNFITPYLISVLYPDLAQLVKQYIQVVNLATLFSILASIVNPFILKFTNLKYQIIIQFLYGMIYIISAFTLSLEYGLYGFCIATLIGFFSKWLLIIIVGALKM